jgi:hypothetical protein
MTAAGASPAEHAAPGYGISWSGSRPDRVRHEAMNGVPRSLHSPTSAPGCAAAVSRSCCSSSVRCCSPASSPGRVVASPSGWTLPPQTGTPWCGGRPGALGGGQAPPGGRPGPHLGGHRAHLVLHRGARPRSAGGSRRQPGRTRRRTGCRAWLRRPAGGAGPDRRVLHHRGAPVRLRRRGPRLGGRLRRGRHRHHRGGRPTDHPAAQDRRRGGGRAHGLIVQTTNLSREWARAVVDVPLPAGTRPTAGAPIAVPLGPPATPDTRSVSRVRSGCEGRWPSPCQLPLLAMRPMNLLMSTTKRSCVPSPTRSCSSSASTRNTSRRPSRSARVARKVTRMPIGVAAR